MKEISMHILDIVMNSVKAEAKLIEITVEEKTAENYLKVIIKDDGRGMSEENAKNATDPFYTTRKTRGVGLGLPLLKDACERCNGYLKINSEIGVGTTVEAYFERNNIDRSPMGNMGDTIMTIVNSLEKCELIYKHQVDDEIFNFSTMQIKEILEETEIKENSVLLWIKQYISENINELYKK